MILTSSLATAVAVFAALEAFMCALLIGPPADNKRMHITLMILALVVLLGLGLLGAG